MSNQQQTIPLWANILCGSVAGSNAEVSLIFKNTVMIKDSF